MQRDIGAARLKVDLPAEARAYVYDNALVPTQWDLTNAAWLARIEEGVRFGFSSIATARIEVQAEDDPAIRFKGRRMVPAYDEVTRIENVALDTTLNISQLVHTNTTLVRKEASRIRITYGPTQWACENVAGWAGLGGDARPGQMLTVNGETFEVVYQGANYGPGHQTYGVRQLRYELYSEPYWEYVTEDVGVNGSIYAQSFLVAQPMQVTSLDINFARVGTDGDVHVFLVETSTGGTPLFDRMLAQGIFKFANLTVGWNKCDLPITLLESGKRYAFVLVTTGAHSVYVSANNKFTGGSMFLTTDGAASQASTEQDICFRLNAAQYKSPRTVIPCTALNLADGMTTIDMLYAGWVPGGCALVVGNPAGRHDAMDRNRRRRSDDKPACRSASLCRIAHGHARHDRPSADDPARHQGDQPCLAQPPEYGCRQPEFRLRHLVVLAGDTVHRRQFRRCAPHVQPGHHGRRIHHCADDDGDHGRSAETDAAHVSVHLRAGSRHHVGTA